MNKFNPSVFLHPTPHQSPQAPIMPPTSRLIDLSTVLTCAMYVGWQNRQLSPTVNHCVHSFADSFDLLICCLMTTLQLRWLARAEWRNNKNSE